MNQDNHLFKIPPCAIPSIPWMKLWLDGHEICAELAYQKQSLRNRYALLGVNGTIWLTIPVESTQGMRTAFQDIRIAGNTWQRIHWRTLQSAYSRAAYWEHYCEPLQTIFQKEHHFLYDLHLACIQWIIDSGIRPNPRESPSFKQEIDNRIWEPSHTWPEQTAYLQVFSDRHPFQSNLSIIDLLMNLGPRSELYLQHVTLSRKSITNSIH